MRKFSRRLQGIAALVMSTSIIVGGICFSNAETSDGKITVEEKIKSSDVENKLADEFKVYDKTVTINTIEELYEKLDEKNDITDNELQEILSSSKDEVVTEYIIDEFMKLNDLETEEIKNEKVEVKYFNSGNDCKWEKVVKTKYGSKAKIEIVDEQEKAVTLKEHRYWFEDDNWKEKLEKEYGSRRFTYKSHPTIGGKKLGTYTSILGYEVQEKCITTNYIKAEYKGILDDVMNTTVDDKIEKHKATKNGENIKGVVIFEHIVPAFDLGLGKKHEMFARMVGDAKKVKGKIIEHQVKSYIGNEWKTVTLPDLLS